MVLPLQTMTEVRVSRRSKEKKRSYAMITTVGEKESSSYFVSVYWKARPEDPLI
jgi:hypothetical protein